MRGRLVDAWRYSWAEVWSQLEELSDAYSDVYTYSDVYMNLYVELVKALSQRPEPSDYDTTVNDPTLARTFLMQVRGTAFKGEPALARFFQDAHDVFQETGNPALPLEFRRLMAEFIACHNLRYQLLTPFKLQPHLPGVFAALFSEIMGAANGDPHIAGLMKDFEHSFHAVSGSHYEADMKTCISKACMLVEGLGKSNAGVNGATLGEICGEVQCWPHKALREAVQKIYGFCSDYPGIRHAGNPRGQLRSLELRDAVIVALFLLTAAGYFLTWRDIPEIIGVNTAGALT